MGISKHQQSWSQGDGRGPPERCLPRGQGRCQLAVSAITLVMKHPQAEPS